MWGLSSMRPTTPRHSDLCLLPLIPESCLIDFLGLAASTRNREKSIGYFPQYRSLSFSFCSLLLPELARIVVRNPLPVACNSSVPACWCKKCSHTSTCSISSLWLSDNIDAYRMPRILSVLFHLMLLTLKYALLLLCFIQMSKTTQRG